mmetsp:Transcript_52/g.141  ORF Transcript_52/g.141 Transcript_52/m.141 type:complete len:86 (-) Transcript_52:23-280(-)
MQHDRSINVIHSHLLQHLHYHILDLCKVLSKHEMQMNRRSLIASNVGRISFIHQAATNDNNSKIHGCDGELLNGASFQNKMANSR